MPRAKGFYLLPSGPGLDKKYLFLVLQLHGNDRHHWSLDVSDTVRTPDYLSYPANALDVLLTPV